jgi:hypothetical protein
MVLVLFIIIQALTLFACSHNSRNKNEPQVCLMELVGEKIFYLDKNTTARSRSIAFFENIQAFASFTYSSGNITFFDYDSGNITHSSKISQPIENIFIAGIDSFYIFSFPQYEFMQTDRNGNIQWKHAFKVGDDLKTWTINPEFSHIAPIILHNSKLYMGCWGLGEYPDVVKSRFDRPVIIEYDIHNKNKKYYSGYPQVYVDNNMGSFQNYPISYTFNPEKNEIAIAFRASCQLSIFNLDTKSEKLVSVKSNYFDSIPLPHPGKDRHYSSQSESFRHYITKPVFGEIIYDKYRQIYYRFVLHGVNNPDLQKGAKAFYDKEMSIIVTDNDFQIIGETPKFLGHYSPQSFVTKEGLHILKLNKDENKAIYSIFRLSDKFVD